MTYYSNTKKELSQAGIQEGELAVYTGTVNPRQPDSLSPNANSKNAYVYLWQDGQPQELDTCLPCDRTGMNVLKIREYAFLRDEPSGYIRQLSGPAKPIVVANICAIPLRIDTFLGKFIVHAGTIQRLDESAPQRKKKKVLLTVSSLDGRLLESAELWDGFFWRRLNICETSVGGKRSLTVRDGRAVVQSINVEGNINDGMQELLMMDSPEPDSDYEIYITGTGRRRETLLFNRSDYQHGEVVQRTRTISFFSWGESVVYDLQKLRESPTQEAARQCVAELPGREAVSVWDEKPHPLHSDKLRAFLEEEDRPGGGSLAPESPENFPE